MSRQGGRGPAGGQTSLPRPGALSSQCKINQRRCRPQASLGVGLGSIIAASLSQLETDNESLEGETSLEPLTPFRCDKGINCQRKCIRVAISAGVGSWGLVASLVFYADGLK